MAVVLSQCLGSPWGPSQKSCHCTLPSSGELSGTLPKVHPASGEPSGTVTKILSLCSPNFWESIRTLAKKRPVLSKLWGPIGTFAKMWSVDSLKLWGNLGYPPQNTATVLSQALGKTSGPSQKSGYCTFPICGDPWATLAKMQPLYYLKLWGSLGHACTNSLFCTSVSSGDPSRTLENCSQRTQNTVAKVGPSIATDIRIRSHKCGHPYSKNAAIHSHRH